MASPVAAPCPSPVSFASRISRFRERPMVGRLRNYADLPDRGVAVRPILRFLV